MGDHRANVKIEFEAHGKTYTTDMYINWFPEDNGVDERVARFFRESWDDALSVYNEQVAEWMAMERDKAERAELERLKKKYDP